jgi:signal transduction histidine kinase
LIVSALQPILRATLRLVKLTRPSTLTLLTCALLVLLPALAVLQYRWVGQVSDAAGDRMQRNLRVAAFQFREAFDNEITRAVVSLRADVTTVREGAWYRYADRYATWSETSEHPGIVGNIYLIDYLIDAEAPPLHVRRWNAATHAFEAAEWPAALLAWRPRLEQTLTALETGGALPRATASDDPSLLFAPLLTAGPRPPGPRIVPNRLYGFIVIQIDMQYLREVLLPALTERHFTNTDGDRYRVAVVDEADPSIVVYSSDPGTVIDAGSADEVEPLHGAFRNPLAFLTRGQNGGRGDGRRTREPGRWALLVQHQSGSLEAAVGSVRRRNLGISFGVLILLTVSVGLLALSSRRAERLARQQMEFVAGVSHELRTPVAVIRSAAENLSQGVIGSGERVKQYGQVIEAEARRLGDMIERVLQYAGMTAGVGSASRGLLAPAEIVESAVESVDATSGIASAGATHPGATIQRTIAPGLPPVVGDAAALRSAVQNLIANAVKYGGPDGWVGIRAEQAEGPAAEVRITVEDHGPGIPGHELPHIFEPFYRGGDAISRQVHGNGLGLALVRQIAAAHGGRVTVSARPGGGSAFTLHLPAAPPDADVRATAAEPRAVHS